MTNVAEAQVIVLANQPLAQRKRARRFWGTMGTVLRFDDRRNAGVDTGIRSAKRITTVRFSPRAPRAK